MLKLIFNRKFRIMIKFDDFNKMIALNSMILINLVQGFDDNPSLGFIKIRSLVRRLSLFIIIYNI